MCARIHRERPGAADLAVATGEPAVALGDGIWMSPGVSNSYAIGTDEGRVSSMAGCSLKVAQQRKAFADVPGPTQAIIVTQGHGDHWGAINALREDGTEVVMHSNYRYWRDDNERLMGYRVPATAVCLSEVHRRRHGILKTVDPATIDFSFPEPTITFDRRLS